MPEISRFYGIIIRMFTREHRPPHFHVQYGAHKAVFTITPPELTRGELPPRARRLVVEWANEHVADLLDDWERSEQQVPLRPIAPLE